MKTILTTLNAKYIHTSLALRLLYVATKDKFDISFKEYVIKNDLQLVSDELIAEKPEVIGISVSIWNVKQTEQLVRLLKEKNPELVIILGGPEVTYDSEYYLNRLPVDYIIKGEGEFVLGELLEALQQRKPAIIPGVSSREHSDQLIVKADLKRLEQLPSPYMLEEDKDLHTNRIVYFETSRGCPYQCLYCLSSLEKGVRYYSNDYIRKNLEYLLSAPTRQIKFLDRTFNLRPEHTFFIFDFLINNYRPNLSCQFEIYADLLPDEMIRYLNDRLPANYFRFEIGIQSTYEPTNKAVKRKQNFPLLSDNIRKLMQGGKIDLHLDLIAGLPHETGERFIRSFNEVFELRAKEVQLGFLKMLRGTELRKNAGKYQYEYDPEAPYEIKSNESVSQEELQRIREAEHALEKYWNSGRFRQTMSALINTHYRGKYFELFDEIGQFQKEQHHPHHGYRLEDLFRYLNQFLQSKGLNLFPLLRADYYSNFTRRVPGFWEETTDKKTKKRILSNIANDKAFLEKHKLTRRIIEKQTAIDAVSDNEYLLTFFISEKKQEHPYLIYHLDTFEI